MHIRTSFSFPLLDLGNIRMAPDLDGGALMDVGCYCVSGARLLGGEPEQVYGEQVIGPTGVDVDFYGTLRFPATSSHSSMRRSRCRTASGWRRSGRRGRSCSRPRGARTGVAGCSLNGEEVDVPAADPYTLELANFAAAIAGEAEPLLGREDALAQARVIEALYRSAESGEPFRSQW